MTDQMREHLEEELRLAYESNDLVIIRKAQLSVTAAQLECAARTSERVKAIEESLAAQKYRAEGARFLWGILQTVASVGGGALILQLLQHL